jgi:hypothetical protein
MLTQHGRSDPNPRTSQLGGERRERQPALVHRRLNRLACLALGRAAQYPKPLWIPMTGCERQGSAKISPRSLPRRLPIPNG